ncbi:MAG TPA: hypothetical protein VK147_08725 [Candidatus Didemnitutus sp.]|nr:hypothetical protein [Candidatus Didemnitutus sp.]
MNPDAEAIIEKLNYCLQQPKGSKLAVTALKALALAFPPLGLAIEYSEDAVQQEINTLAHSLGTINTEQIHQIWDVLNQRVPTKSKLEDLLQRALGFAGVGLSTNAVRSIPVVLNTVTREEFQPYVDIGWINLISTGAVCSMGANNRVGDHVEEQFRPYGMGNGFVLTVLTTKD